MKKHHAQPHPQAVDAPQPVAYDQEGRPLYAHPPTDGQPAPQVVYMSRPLVPQEPVIPESIRQRHKEAKRHYPHLNLSEGEYIISAINRHPIGLISVWAIEVLVIAIIAALTIHIATPQGGTLLSSLGFSVGNFFWVSCMVIILMLLLGWVGTIIYRGNKFFLTNESVIQFIQTGLFSVKEQTISLQNIEDASFRQHGILQHIFDYGSIRLSTEGEETTYRFHFALHPRKQIATLNNAVEAFKNGRPIIPNED